MSEVDLTCVAALTGMKSTYVGPLPHSCSRIMEEISEDGIVESDGLKRFKRLTEGEEKWLEQNLREPEPQPARTPSRQLPVVEEVTAARVL